MNHSAETATERRKFNRMSVDTEVNLSLIGSNKKFTGRSKDLSAKGVAFTTSETGLKKGMLLEMVMNSNNADTPNLETVIEILWLKTAGDNNALTIVGASIKEITTPEESSGQEATAEQV